MKTNIAKIWKTSIITLLILTVTPFAKAQQKYISPVNFPILLAGNVGEIRSDAFHAGIDIKGMKGLGSPVFAVADGYVMRIGVSPWGYGNVLYVKHNNGAISVCAHLHEFAPKIAAWVRAQQYAKKSFTVDLYPSASQFPVKQGQTIATVGNSGSSGGAHVHFEIRDPQSSQPMNIIKEGYYKIADHEKPVIKSIKLYETDTVKGIEIHRLKESIVPSANMQITLRHNGYLVYEIVDYKDGKSNTMGVYSIEQKVDGVVNYSFYMDRIDFTKGRYINAHLQYDQHRASKFDVIRAYVSHNNQLNIYKNIKNRGVITASSSQPLKIETTITDDAGNKTIATITITKDTSPKTTSVPQNAKAVRWNQAFNHNTPELSVTVADKSLYQDELLEFYHQSGTYTIGSADVPLQKPIWVSIPSPVGMNPTKTGLVVIGKDDKISWAGGSSAQNKVTASLRRFGNYRVMEDIVAPVITPQSLAEKGGNLLRFKITDNLSGVSSYVLTIDGAWALPEFDGKTSTLIHKIKRSQTPTAHKIVLVVTDAKNNTTTFRQTVNW